MKLKALLLPILIAAGSLQAQVGIGTKNPQSKLDVKGDIKIGNEQKSDSQGEKGTIRWNDANTCFEGHNGTQWNCLEYKITKGLGTPLVDLTGGEDLKYNNEQSWLDNDDSNDSTKNVLKLNIKKDTKTKLYDLKSGTITANQDGTYKLAYRILLTNHPFGGTFNGTARGFGTWITINNEQASLTQVQLNL